MASEVMDAPPALGLIGDDDMRIEGEVGRNLYKIDANGKLRYWRVEREGHKHRVVSGHADGAAVENAWTECVSKGKGKAQTTPTEQAIKEVEALYKKALDRDYYETPEAAAGPQRNYLPMLAESWKDTTWEKWIGRLDDTPRRGTGAYFQPKLDGFCCIARASGLQSREGLPIVTCKHIEAALAPFFEQYPDAVLHGELYNHDLKDEFEKLGSLLKKQKDISDEHHAEVQAKVQYHMYDFPRFGNEAGEDESRPFGERIADLYAKLHARVRASGDTLQLVETTMVEDEAHLSKLTRWAIEAGYEGGIGRLDQPYDKAKRSWTVIKIKFRMDAEFDLVEVIEGKGNYAGYAKAAMFWRPGADRSNGPTKDTTFKAGIKGERDQYLADLLTAGHKVATVEFFSYTKGGSGVPRQGVATKWHGDKRVL